MNKLIVIGALALISCFSYADDTELFISDASKKSIKRPQVLIIFDNSGSMSKEETVKQSYDPSKTYPGIDGDNSAKNTRVYYSKGGLSGTLPVPNASKEPRHFAVKYSNCAAARIILAKTGFYTGRIREYIIKGNSGSWEEIPDTTGANIRVIDCQEDVNKVPETFSPAVDSSKNIGIDPKTNGAMADGYPVNGKGTSAAPIYYGTLAESKSGVSWTGENVTLYSDNFLRWHHGTTIPKVDKERIDIAKESIVNVINAAPAIDFGLQIFNYNGGDDNDDANGGRIVAGIKQMDATNKTDLIDIIEKDLKATTWTPLCETLFEASRYFAGKSVLFGDDDDQINYTLSNKPPRDTTIEVNSVYQSPFSGCHSKAYVILITDGEPSKDNHANGLIENLTEVVEHDDGTTTTNTFNGAKYGGNYLAALAGWMRNHDINATLPKKQTVDTFPIGFGKDAAAAEPLLKETARLGNQKGLYFKATDSTQLTAALLNILENLEPSNESLTSASVAASNTDSTVTLNSVYYAMFSPQHGPRWQGNLKKYKVVNDIQQGANNVAAIDSITGQFSSTVRSYWTPTTATPDGAIVGEGGAAEMLRNKTNRTIYSNLGSAGSLVPLTSANAKTSFGSNADLAKALDVANNQSDIDDMINWAKGIDVDDEDEDKSTTDIRYDVFGDPLHSKPLVLNYGNGDIRIVIGTNAGVLHMFQDKNDKIDELWSFMPKEFLKNIKPLRDNYSTADKVYGIDGQMTSHIQDFNDDGIIDSSDKVWIFFGLRRGGSSYYALNINSTTPELLWHINEKSTGFSELGQSWSKPEVIFSKVNATATVAKPVVLFSGGYDINKDQAGVGSDDSVGRAIYMVDAETGVLKWSLAPSGGTTDFIGITDSIASNIAPLDSTGNGLTDRLYVGDTGGNLWRVDMPGANPTDSSNPWTVFKLASLGGDSSNSVDRRFFYQPSIVPTFITETINAMVPDGKGGLKPVVRQQEIPYDAILIGSGDRSNPLGKDTQDALFMIKDINIITRSYSASTNPPTPTTIVHTDVSNTDLYNLTTSIFDNTSLSDADRQAEEIKLSAKKGWFINLDKSGGEKNTATAKVLKNNVYFTGYTPPGVITCEVPGGVSNVYVVDLAQGRQVYIKRKIEVGDSFLDSPTLIILRKDDGDPNTIDRPIGNFIIGNRDFPIGLTFDTNRQHLYIQEDQ